VIAEKYRLIIFGRYPYENSGALKLATVLLRRAADGELHAQVVEAVARTGLDCRSGRILSR